MLDRLTRLPLRWAATGFQSVRRALWFVSQPQTLGVHAVALTPRGRVVLVKLRYARGWRLPGGGRSASEDAEAAVLRELREEIGMTVHGAVRPICEIEHRPDFKRDTASLFIVADVAYRPRWSLEVEAVTEADPDRLPDDLSDRTREWLALVGPLLGAGGPGGPGKGDGTSPPE